MPGESASHDFKLMFRAGDIAARLSFVKHLVAMANSGGGTITVGASENAAPGIPESELSELDGAKVSDFINRYTQPIRVNVSHDFERLENGQYLARITITPTGKYPIVFSKQGNHTGSNTPVFRAGEVYVRHGAKTELATYEDYVQLIEAAVSTNQRQFLARIGTLVNLPEGTELTIAHPGGDGSITPASLIDLKVAQRRHNAGAVLDAKELLWCFLERDSYDLTPERLSLLIRSALRRTPTLYFWLAETDNSELIIQILESSLQDRDRDKSDAMTSIPEVAALIADDTQLGRIINEMANSEYAHFRTAAARFPGRSGERAKFQARLDQRATDSTREATSLEAQLCAEAFQLAAQQLSEDRQSVSASRRLADLGRTVWALRRGLLIPQN